MIPDEHGAFDQRPGEQREPARSGDLRRQIEPAGRRARRPAADELHRGRLGGDEGGARLALSVLRPPRT